MTKTTFLFPGQGSQSPGMAAGFMENPVTRELFQQADDTLGIHLSRLVREGSEEDLRATHNAQPALLLAGFAAAHYFMHQVKKPLKDIVSYVAGHSLGEYTAVTVAGGMSLPTALKLVRLRGQAMTAAVPQGQGGMVAVMGLEAPQLADIAKRSGVYVANDNGGGQVILSGPTDALASAEEAAKAAGAKRTIRLNVAGPFHTPAMQPAAQAVQAFLVENPLQPLAVPIVMNATTKATQAEEEVTTNLVTQITSTVRWRESMMELANLGVTQGLELGAGKVLTGLAPRADARLSAVALDSPDAIDRWLDTQPT